MSTQHLLGSSWTAYLYSPFQIFRSPSILLLPVFLLLLSIQCKSYPLQAIGDGTSARKEWIFWCPQHGAALVDSMRSREGRADIDMLVAQIGAGGNHAGNVGMLTSADAYDRLLGPSSRAHTATAAATASGGHYLRPCPLAWRAVHESSDVGGVYNRSLLVAATLGRHRHQLERPWAVTSLMNALRGATVRHRPVGGPALRAYANLAHALLFSAAVPPTAVATMDNSQRPHPNAFLYKPNALWLEFGVYAGVSSNITAWLVGERGVMLHGFDTFSGLPTKWSIFKKNHFDLKNKMPDVDPNRVQFHAGLFAEQLPLVLATRHHDDPLAWANIDCDLYDGAIEVLRLLTSRIRVGTLLHFHELVGWYRRKALPTRVKRQKLAGSNRNPMDEAKAFWDWMTELGECAPQWEMLSYDNGWFGSVVLRAVGVPCR